MNDLYAQIQSAANAGAFGLNGYALPTAANCKAGNYRKGRVKLYGLDIVIETPQGQRRMGKSDGKPWSVVCMAHYGDISGTRGADGDPVDCYVGPSPESNRVFVVNQNGQDGAFDEHKVMLAFADEDAARAAYMGSYERGWTGLGSMVSATVEQFRWWLKHGNTALPFSKKALPYDGEDDMTDITWDSAGMPANSDLATILYGLRLGDSADGLLLDAVQMSDILEDADSLDILDALVVENAKLQPKMEQLQRIMESAGETVKPVALQVSEPFKQKGTTNVTALFELSDGQTVAIFFHNPDSTPNKILPQDELVSWKWLLNKMDVTILVAPEKGRDLNPREVARRIMRLAEKNSAKFQKANGARAERLAGIEQAKGVVAEKESTLASLDAEIADLTAKVEAKRANQAPDPAAALGVSATELATGSGSVEPESIAAIARRLIPAEFKAVNNEPDDFSAVAEDGFGIRLRSGPSGGVLGYVIDAKGQDSLGSRGTDPVQIQDLVETALSVIEELRDTQAVSVDQRPVAVKAELAKLGWQIVKGSLPAHLEMHGARYEIRPSVDEKAQTVTWKDTGGGPEWIDDLSLGDQAMAKKIDSEFRASVEDARASDPILDEYEAIVSEEGRRSRGEALPEAANAAPFPAEQMRDMRETADNFVIGSSISGGTPPTYDQIITRMHEMVAADGADEAARRLAATLNRSREEAKKALSFKAKDLYRDQIGSTANIKADAQIIGAVKSGGLDISTQEWASDFYRLFKIDQSKVGSVNAEGLTEGAAAALKRFSAGRFEAEDASPEDYAAAAKAFLESDPSAPVPRGVRAEWLDIVDVTNVQPTPIEKAINEAKKPADRFKVAYTTAGVRDNRYWLNGVHIDTDRGLVVSTDGHRAMVIEGLDLSMVPPKPDNGRQYSVLSAKGEWIEGKFPDWERVMPSRGSVPGMAKFTAKRVSAFARGAVKAGNYVRKTGHIAIPVQIGELEGFVSAEYMRDLAESFLKMGYGSFKMGMQKRDLSFYAESPDGQMRSIVLGLRVQKAEKLFAPLMPDGQEPAKAAAAPAPATEPEAAAADDDANIGRSWINGYGETVSVESVRDGKYYTLLNGKVGGAPIIPVADLEQTIALDERQHQDKLERERAAAEEQAQEAAAKAEREDTDGFAEQFPQVQRDRIRATLAGNRNTPRGVMSLRDFVRALVADGRVMSEWDGERVLQDPATEGFYNAKDLTKTGLDYAAYLIARRPAAERVADQSQAARELLQSVIDGTADLDEGLTERLEAVHDQFQDNAEIMALFEQAANAFSDAMVAQAKAALA